MVIVGDDCAFTPPPRGPVGRRGLAGTLFVHKVYTLPKGNGIVYMLNLKLSFLNLKTCLPVSLSVSIVFSLCWVVLPVRA